MQATTPATKTVTPATKTVTPATPATPATALTLLAQLQASAPASVSNAQLSALIAQVQGTYVPVQNGINVPTRGTQCVQVWCAVLTYCVTHQQVPNLQQTVTACAGVHTTTVSVQRAKVLKYLGIK